MKEQQKLALIEKIISCFISNIFYEIELGEVPFLDSFSFSGSDLKLNDLPPALKQMIKKQAISLFNKYYKTYLKKINPFLEVKGREDLLSPNKAVETYLTKIQNFPDYLRITALIRSDSDQVKVELLPKLKKIHVTLCSSEGFLIDSFKIHLPVNLKKIDWSLEKGILIIKGLKYSINREKNNL